MSARDELMERITELSRAAEKLLADEGFIPSSVWRGWSGDGRNTVEMIMPGNVARVRELFDATVMMQFAIMFPGFARESADEDAGDVKIGMPDKDDVPALVFFGGDRSGMRMMAYRRLEAGGRTLTPLEFVEKDGSVLHVLDDALCPFSKTQ